ncbi:MAG: hypothetical protein DRN49_05635 [Thaumarchaeota archaeon]|nr:MAG: hypothetical protein DRN49_05635 [Nitrososphaerota archaeon]
MRGQMNIEFIISAGIVLSLLSFIAFKATTTYFLAQSQARGEMMFAKAHAITELLLKYPGKPKNWNNLSEVEIFGLTDGRPYVLAKEKLLTLNACSPTDYERIRNLLGLRLGERFILEVRVFNGTDLISYVSCKPRVISLLAPKYMIMRYATICDPHCKAARIELTVY